MIDYHIHTKLCNHASGEVEEYCQHAVRIGLKEIGFSDHFPVNKQPEYSIDIKQITMREDELETYFQMIPEHYDGLIVKKGFEVDYFPGENLFFNKYKNIWNSVDYIIGSVHFIDECSIDQKEYIEYLTADGIERTWSKYFNIIKEMIVHQSESIDIIGHFDLPKRILGEMPESLFDQIEEMINLIKEKDLVIEVNTSGWDKDKIVKEPYPSESILKRLKAHDVEITIGSDAHKPENVGQYFEKTVSLLKSIGYKRLITFTKHKKDFIDL